MVIETMASAKNEAESYYNQKYSKQLDAWDITVKLSDGREAAGITRSQKISTVGFKGDVTKNDKGFLVQVQKEDFAGGSKSADRPAYQPKDEAAIKAMWAIGQALVLLGGGVGKAGIPDVELVASDLYAMVDRVKVGGIMAAPGTPVADAPLDLSEIPFD